MVLGIVAALGGLVSVPHRPALQARLSRRPAALPPLRVCADPNNLPFSNRAEQGFENRIARLIAWELGREVR